MIIKQLRFANFLVFWGEQHVNLPYEKEASLTVILAPNNTGKTSIIRALRFLFYGSVPGTSQQESHKLINDRAKANAREGAEVSAWVEATVEHNGEERCFRRTVTARRITSGASPWKAGVIRLDEVDRGRTTIFRYDEDGVFQRLLKTIVPETLFDSFYFQGEPLDGKLLGEVTDIRESLTSFLHEDQWEEAERAVESVRQKLHREIESIAVGNQEYKRLLSQEESSQKFIKDQQQDLERAEEKLREIKVNYEATHEELNSLGSTKEIEGLKEQINVADSKQKRAAREIEKADSDLCRSVAASNGIAFLLPALPPAKRILKEMEEQNIIPADLSERFVDRVLASSSCICGREHTPMSRENWLEYKRKTLSFDLNQSLSDLLTAVNETASRGFRSRSNQLAQQIHQARQARAQAIQDEQHWSGKFKQLLEQLQKSPHEKIRLLGEKLKNLANSRAELEREIGRINEKVRSARIQLEHFKREVEKARPAGTGAAKEKRLRTARDRAEHLGDLIRQSRDVLKASFHRILQDSVSAYYNPTATDGSKARIHYDTLLPSIVVNGQERRNLGGGQSQLLALAYVVSLARLRKSLHEQMQQLQIGLGRIDDQSFFLDSPFNQMTDTYAHAIARFLVDSARQTIVLMARHQWDQVREILESQAQRIYALELYTTSEAIAKIKKEDKEKDFVYKIGRKSLSLLKQLPDGETLPRTKILNEV